MKNGQRATDSRAIWLFGLSLSVVSLTFLIDAALAAVPVERVERTDRLAPGPPAAVSLRAESVVRESEILLGDIAEVRGPDTEMVERLRKLEVGRAPLPGLSRTLDLPYLKARLRLQQVDPSTLLWDVPPTVSVTRASQQVAGTDLVAAAQQYLLAGRDADAAPLSIRSMATPPDLVLPAGALELKARGNPPAELTGSVSVTVEAWVDGALVRSVSVPLRVSTLFEVLVAARPIARLALIGPEDVRSERREVLAGQVPLREPGAVAGRRAVRGISAGEPISAAMVELPPLVRRGEIVLLTAEGRGLRAVAQAEAREEGKAGQVIRVRNLASGREVYGQVEAEGTVRVPF